MAWGDTDDGGYGEFGGGYMGAPAGGGWIDDPLSAMNAIYGYNRNTIPSEVDLARWAGQGKRFGQPSTLDQYGNPAGKSLQVTPTDENPGGYLAALQAELAQINQNARDNNALDAAVAHNQNIIGNRISNQGNRIGNRPNTGWVQSTQPFEPFNPSFVDLTDPNLKDPMGGGIGNTPAGTYSFGGYNTGATPVSDAGWAEGGGEPYIRPRRLAYRNAYDQDDPSNFFGGM